jgi:hypothetical protein
VPLSAEEKAKLDEQAFHEVMAEQQPMAAQQQKPGWLQATEPMVLPTAGNIAGGALGGGIGTPFGMTIPGAMIGESIGGGLGEGANQLLGITEPSLSQIGLAMAAPPAMRGAIGGLKAGIARIPGAAVELQALGTKMAKEMAGKTVQPSGTSQELFTMLKQMSDQGVKQGGSGPILLPQKHLLQTSKDILDREMRVPIESSRDASVLKLAEEAKHLAETNPAGIPIEAFQALKSRFGRDMAFDATKPKAGQAANKQLFAALEHDLDEAAKAGGTPAADLLQAATQASKLEMTRNELADHIARKIIQPQQSTNLEYVNAKGLIQHLKTDKRVRGLPLDQQDDLMATAKMLNKIPSLPPPGQFGSGRAVGRAGLVGAATLYATGDPTMSSIAGGVAAGAPQVISYALTTTPGRALLRALLTSNQGTLTHKSLSILSSFMAASQANPGEMTR